MDLPASRLVSVIVWPGKTPSSLMGLPALSKKVVWISRPSMWPRTGKLHRPVNVLSAGAGTISRYGLRPPAVAADTSASAVPTATVSATRVSRFLRLCPFIVHLLSSSPPEGGRLERVGLGPGRPDFGCARGTV